MQQVSLLADPTCIEQCVTAGEEQTISPRSEQKGSAAPGPLKINDILAQLRLESALIDE